MVHTVLVISPEIQERAALCTLIKEKLSYCTTETDDEMGAKEYFLSSGFKKPDVILFDISRYDQPQKKITFLKNIAVHIPIIVITKYGDSETALSAIQYGAQDFLSKPLSIARLKVTFNNMSLLHKLITLNDNGKMPGSVTTLSFFDNNGNIMSIEELEKAAIHNAMQHYNGRMSEVARKLGIG